MQRHHRRNFVVTFYHMRKSGLPQQSCLAFCCANELIIDTDDRSVLQTLGDAGYSALMGAIVGGVVQTADGMISSVRSDPKTLAQQAADAAIAQFKAQTGAAAKPTLAQQIDSMRQQLADTQHKKKLDDLAVVYEKNVGPVEVGTKLDEPVAAGYDNHGKTSEEYLPETEPSTESGSESTTDLKANRIPDIDSVIGHIFQAEEGHIPDTPENRALLEDVANHTENLLGIDMYRNEWYVKILEDGRQVWAEARNGNIFEGGINDMPKPWDPATGLKKSRKESVT